jgi:integrase
MYRRKGRKSWYAEVRTPTGRQSLALGTPNRALAGRIETMWETLALEHRAWDLLSPVLEGERPITALYDGWVAAKTSLPKMREQLADENLEPRATEFLKIYASGGRVAGSVENVTVQLRWLVPEGGTFMKTDATPGKLSMTLAEYPGGQNTRRKVHSSWSVFFDYCTDVLGILTTNPMHKVARPKRYMPLVMFYEPRDVARILERAPSPAMRALWALMYGTGIEVSIALALRTHDFIEVAFEDTMYAEVRAPGTKEHTRDRICLVAEWAWKELKDYMRALDTGRLVGTTDPNALLWPGMHRTSPDHAHLKALRALRLPEYPLYNSRHHWAATRLRAGMPLPIVQKQLGHASPRTTLEVYGRFIPTGADRTMWERRAAGLTARYTATETATGPEDKPPRPVSRLKSRAGNGTRTRDPNLGKVVLYQLSYSRDGNEKYSGPSRAQAEGVDRIPDGVGE